MISIIGCNKGGAGKTTTATNIAVALARQGKDVVVVDADPQRSFAKWSSDREQQEQEPYITLIEKKDNIALALQSLNEKYEHVIVDVAGKNSRELITGATVADLIIAPHQSSQLDLDTLSELEEQLTRVRDLNPKLKVFVYHAMASSNPKVRQIEREEFEEYIKDYPDFHLLNSTGHYRKVYKDAIPLGRGVLEMQNEQAIEEINNLISEVYDGVK
jgi:chromosome partitioning protein